MLVVVLLMVNEQSPSVTDVQVVELPVPVDWVVAAAVSKSARVTPLRLVTPLVPVRSLPILTVMTDWVAPGVGTAWGDTAPIWARGAAAREVAGDEVVDLLVDRSVVAGSGSEDSELGASAVADDPTVDGWADPLFSDVEPVGAAEDSDDGESLDVSAAESFVPSAEEVAGSLLLGSAWVKDGVASEDDFEDSAGC